MKNIIRRSRISWSSKRGSKSSFDGEQTLGQNDDASVLEEDTRAFSSSSSYQDAVLVEISLNWTQDEERLVEAFCSTKEEEDNQQQMHPENNSSLFIESSIVATPHPRSQNFRSNPGAMSQTSFDPTGFIVTEYSSASMREITADLLHLDEDIDANISILKSVVKRNVDLYLSAFSILQELHSLRIKTDTFLTLGSSLKGIILGLSFIFYRIGTENSHNHLANA
ncbi:hypothetical protein MDAP_000328 [Mitosporidium daphniae]|uniref:Exocyst complex component EXOC2/Sec5 N-terminal domain-containing protein n=1 Tax=Mitosporidium daphniae TaxID=1485682 RepID=A0A098VT48_9MICR|nr:uncharacterized protein DI09_196p20 [Mitosporidium daphniae]KGG52268.1 hypothetical protein DI09_196p20 [Mitosporidium daphniae]|eukprot:XP_013238704.1 uncharacterized protein DI09_196p20 [Mitosporidium daphniae]